MFFLEAQQKIASQPAALQQELTGGSIVVPDVPPGKPGKPGPGAGSGARRKRR